LIVNQQENFNEVQAIKDLQKEAKIIIKAFDAFIKVKASEPDALDKLNKALESMPDGKDTTALMGEFQLTAQSILNAVRQNRVKNFKRMETGYIQKVKESGKLLREFSNGWRIGPLEMQVDREQARISFWYNYENLIKWKPIANIEDIEKMEKKAVDMLEKATIPRGIIIQAFWAAYQEAMNRNMHKTNSTLVSITDLYIELRIVLVRQKIAGKTPHRKIDRYAEFPKWAFLYNLDLYRSLLTQIEPEKKLALQTGSMNEVSKGNGYVINGLEAQNEYKVMCYVRPVLEG